MAGDLDDEDEDPMQDIESVTSTNTWDLVKYDIDPTLGKIKKDRSIREVYFLILYRS